MVRLSRVSSRAVCRRSEKMRGDSATVRGRYSRSEMMYWGDKSMANPAHTSAGGDGQNTIYTVRLRSSSEQPSCLPSTCTVPHVPTTGCFIDNHCVAEGEFSTYAEHQCYKCDSSSNKLDWTGPDTSNHCFIGGICYANGVYKTSRVGYSTVTSSCEMCDTSKVRLVLPGCPLTAAGRLLKASSPSHATTYNVTSNASAVDPPRHGREPHPLTCDRRAPTRRARARGASRTTGRSPPLVPASIRRRRAGRHAPTPWSIGWQPTAGSAPPPPTRWEGWETTPTLAGTHRASTPFRRRQATRTLCTTRTTARWTCTSARSTRAATQPRCGSSQATAA